MVTIKQKLYRAVDNKGNQISEWTTSFDTAGDIAGCESDERQPCSVESVMIDSSFEIKLEYTTDWSD